MTRIPTGQGLAVLCALVLLLGFVIPAEAIAQAGDPADAEQSERAGAQEQEEATEVTTYTLSPEKHEKAVAYARARNWLYFISLGWGVVVVLLVLFLGVSARFRDWAEGVSSNRFVQAIVFVPLLIITMDLLDLPTSIYGHWLSVQYEQSIQGWGSWMWDWTKGEMIGLAISIPLIWLLYAVIRKSPARWWFYFWLVTIPVTLLLVLLVPVVVNPLFFEFKPLAGTQPELVERISELVSRTDLEIPPERMFEMNASTKYKAVNAYVTGFGHTKRVVVWDTIIEKMTPEQTLFVFGHELGHYVLNHLLWGIGISILVTLFFLYLGYKGIHWLIGRWGESWGVKGVGDWASFPALLLVLSLLSFLATPVFNAISRYREHEADIYGLEVVHGIVPDAGRVAAEAFQIMGEINLADPEPGEFIKIMRYGHPPLKERVEFASEYDPWSKGEEPRFVK